MGVKRWSRTVSPVRAASRLASAGTATSPRFDERVATAQRGLSETNHRRRRTANKSAALNPCHGLKRVRFCLKQFSAAYSVHFLPRLRGRDREGACNKIEGRCKNIHVRTLTPSPTLPRKRGREHTEFVARVDFTPHELALI